MTRQIGHNPALEWHQYVCYLSPSKEAGGGRPTHEAVGCFGAIDCASAGIVAADRPVGWRAVRVFPAHSGYEDTQR